jgi:hypothetical protein
VPIQASKFTVASSIPDEMQVISSTFKNYYIQLDG